MGGTWDPVGRRCVHPSPDLAIEYFGIAAAPAGKKGRPALTLRIRNRGTTASAPTAAVFSGPAAVLALYGLAGSRSVPRLDPGQAHALTFSPAEKAPDIRAGNYRIGAVVNPKEASFKEAAYGNNAAALVLSVPAQGGSAKQEHEAEPSGRRADH